MKVLDHGSVELLEWMGDDLAIVNAARVSYNQQSKEFGEREARLLKFLLHSYPPHSSPLEQVVFKFRIRLPIFVMRELVRHRMARLNEESGRFKKLAAEFYIPERWRRQDEKNKQSSVYSDTLNHAYLTELVQNVSDKAYQWFLTLLDSGAARELARIVLPLNIYTTCIWQMDLNNLFKFLALRNHPAAQAEIQEYARAIESLIQPVVPVAYALWKEQNDFINAVMTHREEVQHFLVQKGYVESIL